MFGACLPGQLPPGDPDPSVELGVPELLTARRSCDADDSTWVIEGTTEFWTGGGRTWWTRDAEYVERHDLYSTGAAADGSTDGLKVELEIVTDFQDATRNSSTAFSCFDEPNILFIVWDLDQVAVDCAVFGDNHIFAEAGLPLCSTIIEE